VHAAERDLLWAAHRAALSALLQQLASDAAQAMAGKSQAISAHHAARSAALDPSLTPEARAAAIARIRSEEAAELAAMLLEENRRAAAMRSSRIASLKVGHRQMSSAQRMRHRRERAAMSVAMRNRTGLVGQHRQPLQAVRTLARRIRR
jgi:hypothetical protein